MKKHVITSIAGIILLLPFGCMDNPAADNSYDPNNDRVRPEVLSISPAGGQVAVSVNERITASLSEDIDTLSITSDNVVLLDGDKKIVAGVLSYTGRAISFVPVKRLNNCQKYTVVLTDRIRDLAGNTLANDYLWTFTTEISFSPQMVKVPLETDDDPPVSLVPFTMGSSDIDSVEAKEHQVTLGAFYVGKTEVTFDQYDEFCLAVGREKPQANFGRGFMPVVNVSWYDAVDYCNWLSGVSGLQQCYEREGDGPVVKWYPERNGYRLPTEAEWEYAAREAGVTDASGFSGFWPGLGMDMDDYAWHPVNSDGVTHEVASRNHNLLVIHDMSGNVAEWCWDWYAAYDTVPAINPSGPDSSDDYFKVIRGGSWESWNAAPYDVATGMRYRKRATEMRNSIGFRVCRNYQPEP